MQIESERLIIKDITMDDWKRVKEILADFNSSPYAQYGNPHNTEDACVKEKVAEWVNYNNGNERRFFAVCVKETMIGYVGLYSKEVGYELGYCFHSDFQGKGYAKETLKAIIKYFNEQGTTQFVIRTAKKNLPSIKLITSLDFTSVGEENISFYKDSEGNDIVFVGEIFELNLAKD